MRQRVPQRGQRLAPARGHVEPVDAARPLRKRPAPVRDGAPGRVHGRVRRKPRQLSLQMRQPLPPDGPHVIGPSRRLCIAHEFRRVPPVALDHRREHQPRQHPDAEIKLPIVLEHPAQPVHDRLHTGTRRTEPPVQLLRPRALRQKPFCSLFESDILPIHPLPEPRTVRVVHAVHQAMMRRDRIRHDLRRQPLMIVLRAVIPLQHPPAPLKAVNDAAPRPFAVQVALKLLRPLAQVVHQPRQKPGILQSRPLQRSRRMRRRVPAVRLQRLLQQRAVQCHPFMCQHFLISFVISIWDESILTCNIITYQINPVNPSPCFFSGSMLSSTMRSCGTSHVD